MILFIEKNYFLVLIYLSFFSSFNNFYQRINSKKFLSFFFFFGGEKI
jgi:hypothetical protein